MSVRAASTPQWRCLRVPPRRRSEGVRARRLYAAVKVSAPVASTPQWSVYKGLQIWEGVALDEPPFCYDPTLAKAQLGRNLKQIVTNKKSIIKLQTKKNVTKESKEI